MVAGTVIPPHFRSCVYNPPYGAPAPNNGYDMCEIRSGMSVQDLKQLTAQRAMLQQMQYWDSQAMNSPQRSSMHAKDQWGAVGSSSASYCSATSSCSSANSSVVGSPPRMPMSSNNPYASYSHRSNNHPGSTASPPPDKMFVTCGGQVVSFMDGVVNAPQIDVNPDMLSTL